jgi:hypothetical protein
MKSPPSRNYIRRSVSRREVIWSKTTEDLSFSQLKGQFAEQPTLHHTTSSSGGLRKDAVIGDVAPDK